MSELLAAYYDEHELEAKERALFAHLLLEADPDARAVLDFNLTRCAHELGLGAKNGRRTLRSRMLHLVDAEVVSYLPARSGPALGRVDIIDYDRLQARDQTARLTDPKTRAWPRAIRNKILRKLRLRKEGRARARSIAIGPTATWPSCWDR